LLLLLLLPDGWFTSPPHEQISQFPVQIGTDCDRQREANKANKKSNMCVVCAPTVYVMIDDNHRTHISTPHTVEFRRSGALVKIPVFNLLIGVLNCVCEMIEKI
jgi:hypothetical protein